MTAPKRSRGLDGNIRGLIVLGLAVLAGFLLLAKADTGSGSDVTTTGSATTTTVASSGNGGSNGNSSGGTTSSVPKSTTTAAAGGGNQTTGTTRAPQSVTVVVLNGSGGMKGVASAATDKIKAKGYKTLSPGNAAATDKTIVYYANGYQADAVAVAGVLGQPSSSVSAAPANPPAGSAGANVTVVLGKDTPPAT